MDKNLCSSLENLKCHLCQNYLSYFPITLVNDKSICGRCLVDDADAVRVAPYEVLAELHYFPCRFNNEGCTTELRPTDVPNHEQICTFHFVKCLVSSCTWEGTVGHVMQHYTENHSQILLRENQHFNIDLASSHEIEQILFHNNTFFMVSLIIDAEERTLQCLISQHKEMVEKKDYSFYLTLKSEKISLMKEFNVGTQTEKVCLNNFEKDTSTVAAFLTIEKTLSQLAEMHITELSEKILTTLKCTKCSNYILPPIYSDITGLNYCKVCVSENISTSLNAALNNVVKDIAYYCNNSKDGCDFRGIPSLIREHQTVCQFRITNCILSNTSSKCQWQNQHKELLGHLQKKHEIHNNPSKVSFPITFPKHGPGSVSQSALFKFGGFFFILVLTAHKENYICCSVEVINAVNEKFKYEIEIVDINNTGDRMIMRKSCPIFRRFDNFDRKLITRSDLQLSSYCNFQRDDIEGFLGRSESKNGNNLHLKVHIINDVN